MTEISYCKIPDCGGKVVAWGWCDKHYRRWKKYGDPKYLQPKRQVKECSVEGCARNERTRNLCGKHYARLLKYGDPLGTSGRYFNSLEERFEGYTEWRGECLIWTGSIESKGYGQIFNGEKLLMAHRYAWEREHGEIPEGMLIDHKCYNHACVNAEHLRLATKSQNNANLSGLVSGNTSGHRNVIKRGIKWAVQMSKENKKYWFGTYDDLEEAVEEENKNRVELFGEFAGRG